MRADSRIVDAVRPWTDMSVILERVRGKERTYPNSIRISSTSPLALVVFEPEATGAFEYPSPFVVGTAAGASAVILITSLCSM